MATCDICGRTPAAKITLKRNVGLVLARREYTANPVLCSGCADVAMRQFQRETLVKGWTSPSSALINPATMLGNAFRKARHQQKLAAQATSATTRVVEAAATGDHPRMLMELSGLDPVEAGLLSEYVADLGQGGDKSPRAVAARRAPSKARKAEYLEIADGVVECIDVTNDTPMGHGLAHGIFVSNMWEILKMESQDVLPIHQAVSGGAINAVVELLRAGRAVEARWVCLLGLVLYANAADWEQASKSS